MVVYSAVLGVPVIWEQLGMKFQFGIESFETEKFPFVRNEKNLRARRVLDSCNLAVMCHFYGCLSVPDASCTTARSKGLVLLVA